MDSIAPAQLQRTKPLNTHLLFVAALLAAAGLLLPALGLPVWLPLPAGVLAILLVYRVLNNTVEVFMAVRGDALWVAPADGSAPFTIPVSEVLSVSAADDRDGNDLDINLHLRQQPLRRFQAFYHSFNDDDINTLTHFINAIRLQDDSDDNSSNAL